MSSGLILPLNSGLWNKEEKSKYSFFYELFCFEIIFPFFRGKNQEKRHIIKLEVL